MERDNFFIILDLSVDPPQMDPVAIEEAIKRKQTEWSRLRNHPTKGIQAQKYIGIIPEIRKVMMNPELRKKEAKSALEIIRKKEASKFSEIDRHLELLMSKGFIKEEEIFKLAKHHKIATNEIRNRVKQKEKEKFSLLDQQIQDRTQKGYITESEIEALSIIHGMDIKTIRKRISCPVKKEIITRFQKSKPLDPSIIGVIEDNLKIVGKSSLYDFLEISPDSGIKELQQKAKEKEAEILKIRKKDAQATASGVLVGHCISLFKNEKNKASYDGTRIQAYLSKLNMDIDVAGIEGIIRADNFKYLVNRAVEFGMTPREASSYITKYCKDKKWNIGATARKKGKTKNLFIKIIAILLIFSAIAYYGFNLFAQNKLKNEYASLIEGIERLDKPEEKIQVLKNYLASHPPHKYTDQIQKKYEEYWKKLNFHQYETMINAADALINQKKLDEAMEIYVQYKKKNPQSLFSENIAQKMAWLTERMEDRDYEALEKTQKITAEEKIIAYRKYLEKYPSGKHHQNIISLLSDLSDVYYISLMDELTRCESAETWTKCIQLSETFINTYPDDIRSSELKTLRKKYRQRYREEMIFNELKSKANEKGPDYKAAKKIFISYLKLNPDSSLKDRIQQEITLLEKTEKEAEKREKVQNIEDQINKTGGRFVIDNEDVVFDKNTKLMWTLWDSNESATINCLDYETAHQYVAELNTGGYEDWRIPTPKELTVLYQTKPFFPLKNSEWYWTSVSYKSYSDQWVQMVDIFATDPDTTAKQRIDSRRCGAVRAVRP
ncbi:MAG: DUF1566 domain-containing protein [Desulfobacterales bacterium]